MKKLKLLSLFSGKGAFEKSLTNIGVNYEVINYCEINKFSSYAYSILHNVSEDLNLKDVSKVNTSKLPKYDLLTYGFPCQDISLAGKMKGIVEGETRSGLLYEALRIIKDTKPKCAIAENVKNLVSKAFINDFNKMISILDELGYNSYWKVLNSNKFGAAETRERVFIISIRKDVDTKMFDFPKEFESNITLHDMLDKFVDEKYYIDNDYVKEFIHKIKRKVVDNRKSSKYKLLRVGSLRNPKSLDMNNRVFSDEGVSPTLTTSSTDAPKILVHKVRKLTPLECWRITGFTDEDYWKVRKALENKFYNDKDKSDTQMYKMAGNSIVVPVLEHIFKQLLSEVDIIS